MGHLAWDKRMPATSAGHKRGKSNWQNAGNSNRIKDTFLAVEYDFSVNGSKVDSWADMDYDEGRNGRNERNTRGRMNESKQVKGIKE